MLTGLILTACGSRRPVFVVQDYLSILSNEKSAQRDNLDDIITENFRKNHHDSITSFKDENLGWFIGYFEHLFNDPNFIQFTQYIEFKTTYETFSHADNSVKVVARVIIGEKNPGDLERVYAIPDLDHIFKDVMRDGVELPFQFILVREDGAWKIDELILPEKLEELLEKTEALPDGFNQVQTEEN
jgi:hypothetical protein